jgi:hypothetical protein
LTPYWPKTLLGDPIQLSRGFLGESGEKSCFGLPGAPPYTKSNHSTVDTLQDGRPQGFITTNKKTMSSILF